MNLKKNYLIIGILIILLLVIVGLVIYFQLNKKNPEKCIPRYVLDKAHLLNLRYSENRTFDNVELETVKKFKQGNCSDGNKPLKIVIQESPPKVMDPSFEIIYYCESENSYLVHKAVSIAGSRMYLYYGKPCK